MDSVCMGRGVGIKEKSPSVLFLAAKVKAGRGKKASQGAATLAWKVGIKIRKFQ